MTSAAPPGPPTCPVFEARSAVDQHVLQPDSLAIHCMEAELGSVPCVGWLPYVESKRVVTSLLDPDHDLNAFNLTRVQLERVGGVEEVISRSRAFVFRGVYLQHPTGSGLKIKRDNTRQPGREKGCRSSALAHHPRRWRS